VGNTVVPGCRERILHITHVLADVYEETPNPEEHIKPHHRNRARQFMQAVEANDVQKWVWHRLIDMGSSGM
jgi:hypothetical protein